MKTEQLPDDRDKKIAVNADVTKTTSETPTIEFETPWIAFYFLVEWCAVFFYKTSVLVVTGSPLQVYFKATRQQMIC